VSRDLSHRLLRCFIIEAVNAQPPHLHLPIAEHLDAGRYRVLSYLDVDAHDRPDPDSLTFLVEVEVSDGWAGLCSVHHSRLGLTAEDVATEIQSIAWQNGRGIPDDASSLTGP